MSANNVLETALSSLQASDVALNLLRDIHGQALAEEPFVSTTHSLADALDKYVALDPDKAALVYHLLRSSGALCVVEAGTSFGVSTIYLALAVGQNAKLRNSTGRVIATENEPTKAAKARAHWKAAGDEVEPYIELREGDLRETLKADLPEQIDFVLLDIWAPLALPALSLVHSKLKIGATVVVDNYTVAADGYKDLRAFLGDPENGFKVTLLPYDGGLCMATYLG